MSAAKCETPVGNCDSVGNCRFILKAIDELAQRCVSDEFGTALVPTTWPETILEIVEDFFSVSATCGTPDINVDIL
jgi:hypothetical protein